MNRSLTEAFKQGWDAAVNERAFLECPYERMSPLWVKWRSGYMTAIEKVRAIQELHNA